MKTRMKMTVEDKYQAIRRNSKYKEDYLKINKWCESNNVSFQDCLDQFISSPSERFIKEPKNKAVLNIIKKLCDKYGLEYPIEPIISSKDLIMKYNDMSFDPRFYFGFKYPIELIYPTNYKDVTTKKTKKHRTPRVPVFDEGECVTVKINLHANKKEIEKNLFPMLKYFQRFIRKTRRREGSINPWEVYKWHKNFCETFREITRKIFNIKDNDKGFDARRKRVEGAYKKAQRMINQ